MLILSFLWTDLLLVVEMLRQIWWKWIWECVEVIIVEWINSWKLSREIFQKISIQWRFLGKFLGVRTDFFKDSVVWFHSKCLNCATINNPLWIPSLSTSKTVQLTETFHDLSTSPHQKPKLMKKFVYFWQNVLWFSHCHRLHVRHNRCK